MPANSIVALGPRKHQPGPMFVSRLFFRVAMASLLWTLAAANLPAGLDLDSQTGLIAGTAWCSSACGLWIRPNEHPD